MITMPAIVMVEILAVLAETIAAVPVVRVDVITMIAGETGIDIIIDPIAIQEGLHATDQEAVDMRMTTNTTGLDEEPGVLDTAIVILARALVLELHPGLPAAETVLAPGPEITDATKHNKLVHLTVWK